MNECRSCEAPIRWALTVKGKRMPLDPDPVERTAEHGVGLFVLVDVDGRETAVADTAETPADLPRYKSHFATCPNAARHRRARGSTLDA